MIKILDQELAEVTIDDVRCMDGEDKEKYFGIKEKLAKKR